ncbi:hypothetical protein KIL84_003837 [Mauremys mutica]|uniref:Uncharacterized protein n=1 Tax=Mauremys mutica TaxID=74926 RepID=A0A9D3WQ83_9SAUR|nr:hypothetical protein KIL84_003837 [Mauremys mutica]
MKLSCSGRGVLSILVISSPGTFPALMNLVSLGGQPVADTRCLEVPGQHFSLSLTCCEDMAESFTAPALWVPQGKGALKSLAGQAPGVCVGVHHSAQVSDKKMEAQRGNDYSVHGGVQLCLLNSCSRNPIAKLFSFAHCHGLCRLPPPQLQGCMEEGERSFVRT